MKNYEVTYYGFNYDLGHTDLLTVVCHGITEVWELLNTVAVDDIVSVVALKGNH